MDNKFKIYKISLTLIWIFFISVIFVSSLKTQVVLSEKTKTQFYTLFPEGWSFFTRNPREPLLEVYKIDNGKLISMPLSNSSMINSFGFSRKSRVKGFEASTIISEIPSNLWKENKGNNYIKDINDNFVNVKYKKSNHYFNKGKYLFVLKDPIPWAWASKSQDKYAPYSAIKININ